MNPPTSYYCLESPSRCYCTTQLAIPLTPSNNITCFMDVNGDCCLYILKQSVHQGISCPSKTPALFFVKPLLKPTNCPNPFFEQFHTIFRIVWLVLYVIPQQITLLSELNPIYINLILKAKTKAK